MNEKCWAVAATTNEHAIADRRTVFWQNTGKPTVWQPEPGEWLFTREQAAEIASRMEGVSDVFNVRPMFVERATLQCLSFEEAKKESLEMYGDAFKKLADR